MRYSAVAALLTSLVISTTATSPPRLSPFLPPLVQDVFDPSSNGSAVDLVQLELQRRQNTCPENFEACSNLGAAGACCASGTNCQKDGADHVACCPDGSSCTGTINVGTQSAPASSSPGGGGGGGGGVVPPGGSTAATLPSTAAPTTNGFLPPSTTTSPGVSLQGFSASSSITNQYFTFLALPTTFANERECSSGYSECQSQYSSCTARLGGTNGVTVSGPGASVTVNAGPITLGPTATSICQSLSSQACHGLVVESCNLFGTGVIPNANAAPTGCAPMYGMGIGVALGVAGQVLG
ncbi:MAG: hypothetical protein M1837_001885 [Sclerophora amabilis]|nr:MAG: hypothetical protein M1837_001885 [Sclerophora amabilis]